LGELGEAKPGAQVFGIQQRGGQFRQGRSSLSCGEKDFFLQGMETDREEKAEGQRGRSGENQNPGRGFQE
jgi:hypothetical protein